jgi:hypothetical protein
LITLRLAFGFFDANSKSPTLLSDIGRLSEVLSPEISFLPGHSACPRRGNGG